VARIAGSGHSNRSETSTHVGIASQGGPRPAHTCPLSSRIPGPIERHARRRNQPSECRASRARHFGSRSPRFSAGARHEKRDRRSRPDFADRDVSPPCPQGSFSTPVDGKQITARQNFTMIAMFRRFSSLRKSGVHPGTTEPSGPILPPGGVMPPRPVK